MDRRRFLLASVVPILGARIVAEAQQPRIVHRIGFIGSVSSARNSTAAALIDAFRDRLRELGWVEGRNVSLMFRFYEGKLDRVPAFIEEFVRARVDVIVSVGDPTTEAVMRVTRTIPIVMATAADPVKIGAAESLARPGKNATGLIMYGDPQIFGKYVELLKELRPQTKRLAILWDVDPGYPHLATMSRTAQTLGMEARVHELRNSADLHRALTSFTADRPEALFVLSGPINRTERERIIGWTLKHRVPTMSDFGPFVREGLLIAYSIDFVQLNRRVAEFVDRILRGAKPADLPIEQPTRFQLVINLKTASDVGIKVPQSLLSRADDLIP